MTASDWPDQPLAPDTRPFLEVAAGIVHRPLPGAAGHWEVLMGQRPQGKAYAGWWEFPGGKIETGESVAAALARELREELDLEVLASLPWVVREHSYPHARVRLHFHRIFDWRGEARSMEAQAFAWQSLDRINLNPLLPAALPLLEMLRWQGRLGVHGFGSHEARIDTLEAMVARARAQGLERVLVRLGGPLEASACGVLAAVLERAAKEGVQLMPDEAGMLALARAVPQFSCAGYWREGRQETHDSIEVWARGGLFSAASSSAADDLRRSERALPDDGAEVFTLQACVLAASAKGTSDAKALATTAKAPLYWPDERLLALGGHGVTLAV